MTSLSCSFRSLPAPSPRLSAARIASSTVLISLDSVTSCPRVLRCLRQRSLWPLSMAVVVGTERKKAVEVFNTEEALATSIAEHTACLSEKFFRARGACSVVLSGGSLFKFLSKRITAPYVDAVDWSKRHVIWFYERVVHKDHDGSNTFMQSLTRSPPEGAADDYETCLTHQVKGGVVASSERIRLPKFDLMLLGMGADRHITSLFPGHPLANENKKWVAFIKDSPKPPREIITFTFPIINSSAYIALVVAGFGKAGAVHTAMVNGEDAVGLPVQMVSPEGE